MVYARNYINAEICFVYFKRRKSILWLRLSVLLVLLLPHFTTAQSLLHASRDSLITALDKLGDDTTKVHVYDKLAYVYSIINPDSGLVFAKQALDLANRLKWEKGIAVAHSDLGLNYRAKAEYIKAFQ